MPGSRCEGTLDSRSESDVAPPSLFVDRSLGPVLAIATSPAIRARRRLGPKETASLSDSQKVSYYNRVTPPRACHRARRTPFSGRGCLRDGRPRWGSVHSSDEGPLGFRRAALLTQSAVHGPVDPVPHSCAGVAWTLNKGNSGKGV